LQLSVALYLSSNSWDIKGNHVLKGANMFISLYFF